MLTGDLAPIQRSKIASFLSTKFPIIFVVFETQVLERYCRNSELTIDSPTDVTTCDRQEGRRRWHLPNVSGISAIYLRHSTYFPGPRQLMVDTFNAMWYISPYTIEYRAALLLRS